MIFLPCLAFQPTPARHLDYWLLLREGGIVASYGVDGLSWMAFPVLFVGLPTGAFDWGSNGFCSAFLVLFLTYCLASTLDCWFFRTSTLPGSTSSFFYWSSSPCTLNCCCTCALMSSDTVLFRLNFDCLFLFNFSFLIGRAFEHIALNILIFLVWSLARCLSLTVDRYLYINLT